MSDPQWSMVTVWVALVVLFIWHSVDLWRAGRWQMLIDGWAILAVSGSVIVLLMYVWGVPWWGAAPLHIIVMGWTRDRIRDWRVARGAVQVNCNVRRATGIRQ